MSDPNANDRLLAFGGALQGCSGALYGCGCLMTLFVTIPILLLPLILLFLALLG